MVGNEGIARMMRIYTARRVKGENVAELAEEAMAMSGTQALQVFHLRMDGGAVASIPHGLTEELDEARSANTQVCWIFEVL